MWDDQCAIFAILYWKFIWNTFYHVTGPVKIDQVGTQNATVIFKFIVS